MRKKRFFATLISCSLSVLEEMQQDCKPISCSLWDWDGTKITGEQPDQLSTATWLVVSSIYFALAVFQTYRDLEAADNRSLKFKWRSRESNPGPLALQAKNLTTQPPPLLSTASSPRGLGTRCCI